MLPGDYIVTRSTGWAARLIQIGTRSRWNHAAVFVGDVDGVPSIIEALPSGVTLSPLANYAHRDLRESAVPLTDLQRAQITAYAREHIGTAYGWLDIVALALVAFGIRPKWLDDFARRDDRLVCSQLVACAYDAAGVRFDDADPWTVTPGDLAEAILEAEQPG